MGHVVVIRSTVTIVTMEIYSAADPIGNWIKVIKQNKIKGGARYRMSQ